MPTVMYNNVKSALVYQFVIIFLTLTLSFCNKTVTSGPKTAPKSGPFYARLIRTERCKNPTIPFEKNPRVTLKAELYNTSTKQNLWRGNITVHRQLGNYKIRIKGFIWKNDKWVLKYLFSNVNCNGWLISTANALFGIKPINGRACSLPKGITKFEGLDFNALDHIAWAFEREYGRMLWFFEAYTKSGTIECWENEAQVTPI